MFDRFDIDDLLLRALKEDMPMGDITTDNTISEYSKSHACFISKDEGVLAGVDIAKRVFELLDSTVAFKKYFNDGDVIRKTDVIAEVEGNTRALLKAERTALNIMQRLSGIATKARLFSEEVKDLPVKIVDTRKTTPGLRMLEKYAVRVGGAYNHRFCLSDGVLIKDNHIKAAGGVKKAIEMVRGNIPHTVKIEVETENMDMVKEAVEAGADIIMLDNMSLDMMREAVRFINKRADVEASGNVNINTVRDIALTGVDIISVGELTHSVRAFDISMKFK